MLKISFKNSAKFLSKVQSTQCVFVYISSAAIAQNIELRKLPDKKINILDKDKLIITTYKDISCSLKKQRIKRKKKRIKTLYEI